MSTKDSCSLLHAAASSSATMATATATAMSIGSHRNRFTQCGGSWSQQAQRAAPRSRTRASLMAEKTKISDSRQPRTAQLLACDLVQGALVRWSEVRDKSMAEPPTAVFLHGILGSRKNWASFARRLAQCFPTWQFLLVDLRCHGESLQMTGTHTVASAAQDVLRLLAKLRLTPRVLVGHSFGGKVVLSVIDQAGKPLARPVQAWVLDTTPGKVAAGGDGKDRPSKLIEALKEMPAEIPSRQYVVNSLLEKGFSIGIAKWMTTNLKAIDSRLDWSLDLNGIAAMCQSYEETSLWNLVDNVPEGVHLRFLRAERSLHIWERETIQRIHDAELAAEGAGVELHVLEDAGHWVHADNPDGLFKTLAPSFF